MATPRKAPGETRQEVALPLATGASLAEISRALGVSKPTVSYHARQLGRPLDERANRRYDWPAVQGYYDEGNSIRACVEAFGMAPGTIIAAAKRGQFVTRPQAMPIDKLLSGPRNRKHIKMRLIAAGLKSHRCETCGIDSWRDAPISLQLHHVNGVGDDNRLENLQLLCPNCHSQTDTFGGRNRPAGPAQPGGDAKPV